MAVAPGARWAFAECFIVDTPCRDYAHYPVIFQGCVERIAPFDDGHLRSPDPSQPVHVIRMRVERAWKGLASVRSVDLFEGSSFDTDYHQFRVGERYLVYAGREAKTGRLWPYACERTKPLLDAADDLEFLESLSRAAPGGWIYGWVHRNEYESGRGTSVPIPNARLLLIAPGVRLEARTDAAGRFDFRGLKPGEYHLSMPDAAVVDSWVPGTWGAHPIRRAVLR